MRKQDLFRLCLQNLLRKRSRTFLTVLGAVSYTHLTLPTKRIV